MFRSIRDFVGHHQQEGRAVTVLAADDPDRRLMGYTAFTGDGENEVGYGVSVSIYDVRFSLENDFSSAERDRLVAFWHTAAGRRQIAQALLTRLPYEPG